MQLDIYKLRYNFSNFVELNNRCNIKKSKRHYIVTGTFLETIEEDKTNYFEGHRGEVVSSGYVTVDLFINTCGNSRTLDIEVKLK